jgi:hypothetical protein
MQTQTTIATTIAPSTKQGKKQQKKLAHRNAKLASGIKSATMHMLNVFKESRTGQMKNLAHLKGLAKKACSRQMLACPFVDNAVIQSNNAFMNSLTVQTVQPDLVYMAISIVIEQRLDNCPMMKQSLTRKLAKNQKRVESETEKKN